MIKKISLLLSLMLLIGCFTACSTEPPKPELTEKDYEYIDNVYNSMSSWDIVARDGSETYTIDKISFFDFTGNGKVTFFVNYPIAAFYGRGFYIFKDEVDQIQPSSVYDTDTSTRLNSCYANNSQTGTNWNSSASDTQKYETIKKAYLTYLEKQ